MRHLTKIKLDSKFTTIRHSTNNPIIIDVYQINTI